MDKEKQNIAIAEWMGWKAIRPVGEMNPDVNERSYLGGKCPADGRALGNEETWWRFTARVPSYTEDLNAMHEAENKFIKERMGYVLSHHLHEVMDAGYLWNVKASVRCEALLKAIGKWEE